MLEEEEVVVDRTLLIDDVDDPELLLEDVLGRALLIADAALEDALESTEERLDATLLLEEEEEEDESKLKDALEGYDGAKTPLDDTTGRADETLDAVTVDTVEERGATVDPVWTRLDEVVRVAELDGIGVDCVERDEVLTTGETVIAIMLVLV